MFIQMMYPGRNQNNEIGRVLEYGHPSPRGISKDAKGWLIAGTVLVLLLGAGTLLMYYCFSTFFDFSVAP